MGESVPSINNGKVIDDFNGGLWAEGEASLFIDQGNQAMSGCVITPVCISTLICANDLIENPCGPKCHRSFGRLADP